MSLQTRLTLLETERARRRRLRVASVLAPLEGVSVDEAFERTFVDPADQAAVLARFGRGLVDVGELTRFLAAHHGLTSEETAEAIAQAERCHAQLEDHHGPA